MLELWNEAGRHHSSLHVALAKNLHNCFQL